MEIYNESMERMQDADLSLGYLKSAIRVVHHEAIEGIEEKWHYEVVKEYPNGGRDVKKVIDVAGVQAKDAWDEEIPIRIYVPYMQEELDAMETERSKPAQKERIDALEAQLAAYEAAYAQGVKEA